jgi:phage-related baseplate assembly protein
VSATTAPSFTDFFNTGRAEAAGRRPDLTFDDGDISELCVIAGAAMADMLTGYAADRVRVSILDGASGDDLTALANDRWNIPRKPAVAGTGSVSISRPAPGVGSAPAGTLAAGFVVATAKDAQGNDVQFTFDSAVNWALNELGPKNVNVTAVATGPAGNVDIGKITKFVSTPFDTSFSVSNAARIVGGDAAEEDSDLRERVRLFPVTLRRGTLAALEFGALSVDSVKKATAVEDVPAPGQVTVYVTDNGGGSSPQMVSAVQTELLNWRAAGVNVVAAGGSLVPANLVLTLNVRAGIDIAAIRANILSAVTARISKLRIGESLDASVVAAAAVGVDPNGILGVAVSPSTTVANSSQIIRAGAITVN